MKLNVHISRSGYCSRRNAALLIKEGRVTVNGKTISEPWLEVNPGDKVSVNKKLLVQEQKHVYLVFNKPKGVTVTLDDPFAEKKITDFIPKGLGRVFPVGRLDKFSRGIIILTNDGELCYQLTHPKFEIEKEYLVTVKGALDEKVLLKLKSGIREDGDMLKVKSAYMVKSNDDKSVIKVVVCEGKKRHLRRLFWGLEMDVIDLKRVRIGHLELGGLKEGNFKIIDQKTIYSLTTKKH